jgi:hypothetical protein
MMFVAEGNTVYKDLCRVTEVLATPIDFARLFTEGVLQKRGEWYEVLDVSRLPDEACVKIKAVRAPSLVKFRKPSKPLQKFLRRGY